ncbi:kinase-like protein [Cubamyces sp. BRFM 1775]|nr:kinase-like protein [Cubamyces sp. BRFM 1775]
MSYFGAPSGYYQVLEICQGGSLSELLDAREDHVLTEEELRGMSRSLVDALIYLRNQLVLHRDINPSNILITGDGRVKLSGFGSAQRLPTADATVAEFCGAANYVSPEILCGRPYSFPSDLWSFGAVLLTCLSGLPPFNDADPDAVYNNICSARFFLPNTVSAEAEDLIQFLLCKNPNDRIALHRIPWHPFLETSHPTTPLNTHKISRGQLVILPSRSLLVDFREGERRKGGKGKEVLVISPDGRTIQVFDAPHLSTPCCLAEATATYTVEDLPQRYAAQYNDAARMVDHLKSRTPKLVHYSGGAKCTLMANGPPGDIEIVMPADEERKNSREAVRLRLCIKKHTLEISRYIDKSSKGKAQNLGEWTKKIVALEPNLALMEEDRLGLDDIERLAVGELSSFVSLCDAASLLQVDGALDLATKPGKDTAVVD